MMPARAGFFAAALLCGAVTLHSEVLDQSKTISGLKVEYKVVLPDRYDPSKAYPGILAFGGGAQEMGMVDTDVRLTWRANSEKRGYIAIEPAAPDDELFFQGGERVFPEFLKQLLSEYKILNNKFHIAGHSNGGISAFHVAALYPQYFISITGFPGYLINATPERLKAISKMCIYMYAGELDHEWTREMETQSREFQKMGMSVKTAVEKGQPHRIMTLTGDGAGRLFDQFDEARKGCAR